MDNIFRYFTEKKQGFNAEAKHLQDELSEILNLPSIFLRIFNRYDIENLPPDKKDDVANIVLSEPMSDILYEETLPKFSESIFLLCIEPLRGQFDIRADSCEQCIQMLIGGERPIVRTAKIYAIDGINKEDFNRIKEYIINPLESREASFEKPLTLSDNKKLSFERIPIIENFISLNTEELSNLHENFALAMSLNDLKLVQQFFQEEKRNPTLTEIRVIDTYWSDHCRHTTFNTNIKTVDIQDERVKKAYELFLSVNGDKPVTLMNMATAAMRHLRKQDALPMLYISEENNACTIRINAKFKQGQEDWLLFFKNETHNHPTEIEPFGGASTCIGGAIRDPLSGRAYVYQAMRITGSGDPRQPISETIQGKIPQRKLTVTAADGYSSYGNQIGIATGYVKELYHSGYIAKRLETGAVVGAAPLSYVRRETPSSGDVIILLGGRTGRDGIGGATGSSKTHGINTVSECASEVQKGNAAEERKLQRLFRSPNVTKLIKRCNDFGAGGICVAIGELADGVEINLDNVPVKYQGLDGTELATSESQERMAVVVEKYNAEKFLLFAASENIEATVVAKITQNKRLIMFWRGKKIVDISREFLDTNGAERFADICVLPTLTDTKTTENLKQLAADINFCSQKGLVERFDNTIGTGSIFMPHGGKFALTESQVMAALLPKKDALTASVMAYGFDPYLTAADPFGGSAYAVVVSVAKLIATGVSLDTVHLSLQEYFPRINDDPKRWGIPFAAMLGAFSAQMGLGIAAIGGKDSMSGSYNNLDVPPTLISFAVGIANATDLISTEFKGTENFVYLLEADNDYKILREQWNNYIKLCRTGAVLSAWACEKGGICGGIMKMSLGNGIGFVSKDEIPFTLPVGSIIFESDQKLDDFKLLGITQKDSVLSFGNESLALKELRELWESPLEKIFPVKTKTQGSAPIINYEKRIISPKFSFAKPTAVIPVFPGTNCEYDTAAAIENAGGNAEIILVRNLTPEMLQASVAALEKAIEKSQMIIFPGGFSGGDEPDGSGKFIVSLFRNPRLTEAVHNLLQNRDGLILGICNGFQALIKLGLVPYGKITPMTENCPTLTFNQIGRHQSQYVVTRVASVMSPWLSQCNCGELYTQPISHGEGKFTASPETLQSLKDNGQIVFQYTDFNGNPSTDIEHNPNGSDWAIEGICSPDGRVLGKMAHTERFNEHIAKNISGNKFLPIFEGGVNYFK